MTSSEAADVARTLTNLSLGVRFAACDPAGTASVLR